MRKIWILAAMVILLVSLSISAFAATNTYYLQELGVNVNISSEYSVLTRETPENSSIFTELGMTKAEVMTRFKDTNTYFYAFNNKNSDDITISMTETNDYGLQYASDSFLMQVVKPLAEEYKKSGFEVSEYDVYQHPQTKFIRVYFTDNQTMHGVQYYTVHKGKAINIVIKLYKDTFLNVDKILYEYLVSDILFETPNYDVIDSESFLYTDNKSGVSFTVPANWKEVESNEETSALKAGFAFTKEKVYFMAYYFWDLWSEMAPDAKIGFTRADVNNSMFSFIDIKEMFQTTIDKVSTVSYNGVEYYKCEKPYVIEVDGVEFSVTATQLIYINNGWVYMFQFTGASNNLLYPDFEKLIESVKYSSVSLESTTPNKEPSEPSASDSNANITPNVDWNTVSDDNDTTAVVVIVLIVAMAVAVGVICWRRKSGDFDDYADDFAEEEPAEMTQPYSSVPSAQTIVCKHCGQKLPTDSVFCHFCGTKIEKEDSKP